MLAITGSTTPIQAAPPTPPPPPIPLFPRSTEVESLSHLPGAESPATAPQAIDALSLYPWSRLTFQSYRNLSNWEIFIGNDDGSSQAQLTFDGASDLHPRLNRGATRLVFASRRTGNYEIFTMNPDGSGLTQITFNGADDVQPYWSPDGNLITFQAYRDGQPEVYVMNADGSGQTRLTYNADYDGEPAWSPDGGKIAFVSKRTAGAGDYFIWVMNADGNNQVQLSGWAYSEGPVWSPDGTRIAYDAAGSDYWQNLHVMNANGSNDQVVFDEGGWADAWARSWSPDSRYVAFTRIYYVQCGSNLCWTNAYLDAWDSQIGGVIRLSHTGYDWRPDWQSTDTAAPASTVTALPPESPGPFTVSWSGSDNLSGIGSYDVQVKDGAGGTWTNWQTGTTATSAAYPGVGGHSYYFRVRARDKSGNIEAYPAGPDAVTTVETLAPNSAVQPLVEFSKNTVVVKWHGTDVGGSGIAAYDVQYQDVTASGSWMDWQTAVVATSSTFTGTVGHTYAFRARAIDKAYNQEAYPANGDAQTAFYAWAISGVVRDNTGAPVSNATIATIPEAARVFTSNVDGVYAAYVLTPTVTYTTTWAKNGYATLPNTGFTSTYQALSEVFLPPEDNVIQDWGFESGDLGINWAVGGVFTPVLTTTIRHTGHQSVMLGKGNEFTSAINISQTPDNPPYEYVIPHMVVDSDDVLHVTWVEDSSPYSKSLFYTYKPPLGNWSAAVMIPEGPIGYFEMEVDEADNIYIIWTGWDGLTYLSKPKTGNWSAPIVIPETDYGFEAKLVVDRMGTFHVVWWARLCSGCTSDGIYYSTKPENGNWSSPVLVSSPAINGGTGEPLIAIGPDGVLHLAWAQPINNYYQVYYSNKTPQGNWSLPVSVSTDQDSLWSLDLAVDAIGNLHIIWGSVDSLDPGVTWVSRQNGFWTPPLKIYSGNVSWSPSQIVATTHLQVVMAENTIGSDYEIYYMWRALDSGDWIAPVNMSNTPGISTFPALTIDSANAPHVVWRDTTVSTEVYYAGPVTVNQTGISFLTQAVTLPLTLSTPTLSFLYQLDGASALNDTGFSVEVDDGVAQTVVFSTTSNTGQWLHYSADLSNWAGQAVTLTFKAHEVAGFPPVAVYLDEISLGSAYPDLWATLNSPLITQPGNTLTYTLTYGNQGGAPAPGTQLTLTLPAELTFADSSLPPLTSTSEIVWEVGDLAAKSGPYTIVVTATVAPTATFFSTLTSTLSLSTSSAELETANNGAQASTFITYQIFFPIVRRD